MSNQMVVETAPHCESELPPCCTHTVTKTVVSSMSDSLGSQGTAMTGDSSGTNTNKHSLGTQSRAVWAIRLVFLLFLVGVAVALGIGAYYILRASEKDLGEQQFDALAARALDLGEELAIRRRVVVKSMAQVAASAFPNSTMWPNVAIPAFETIAADLISTSSHMEFGFYPCVLPEETEPGQQASFEAFAYDYFYNKRSPTFNNKTAVHNFGRGVWKTNDVHANTSYLRLRDTNGQAYWWDSPYRVLFPELQNSNDGPVGRLFLMFNIHSIESKGAPIDEVMACTDERKATQNQEMDCGVVTEILSHNRASFLIQPIYPTRDLLKFTGVIVSRVSWDIIIATMFEDSVVCGLTAVLESEGKTYSYSVYNGITVFSGEGDFHDTRFSEYGRTISLSGTVLSGASSRHYDLTLYPTEDFFVLYSTGNPMIAMVGAVLIVFVTSLIFFVYDFVVRREFSANQELLEAKRKFMRFVSHEVRTPLNAVCMGLALLQEELGQTLRRCQSSEGCYGELNQESDGPTEEIELETCQSSERCRDESDVESAHVTKERNMIETSLNEWLALTEEICSSANSSVDVLNDLLNYDKIETGSLSLELTVFSIWSLIIETSSEFRLSAKKKMINFELDFSPVVGEKPAENLESLDNTIIPRQLRERRVVGDLIRITQVLRNLVSNALKFTPVDGNLTIQMSSVQSKLTDRLHVDKYTLKSGEEVAFQRSGSVQIKVIDTGAGMSQEQLTALFRDGVQFNVNELQAGQGSGLGLFISKGIVKQHGGDLEVSSGGIGRGSTFTCTLPLYHVPDAPVESTTSIISQAPVDEVVAPIVETVDFLPLRILVVDDVASNRKLLSRLATKRGHSVDQADDGRQAVDRVKIALRESNRYDTILMDYEMPVLSGPEAAKEIRELGCDSFIVGITGNLLAEDVNYYLSCGANFVLPKPVDFRKLEELWFERGVSGQTANEGVQ